MASAPPPYLTNEEILIRRFGHVPSLTMAWVAFGLFAAVGLVNLGITARTRAWFMLLVPLTAFCEAAGYIFRVIDIHDPTFSSYVAMQCLLIIPPVFLAAVDYWGLKIIISKACPPDADTFIKPKLLAWIMVASDLVTLTIQAVGAAQLSSAVGNAGKEDLARTGKTVMLVGLALQLVFFGFFTAFALYLKLSPQFGLRGVAYWRPAFFALFSTIVLLTVRNIYRCVEFGDGGFNSSVASIEWLFYCLDFGMIFACCCVMCVWHFGWYIGPRCEVPPPKGWELPTTAHPAADCRGSASKV